MLTKLPPAASVSVGPAKGLVLISGAARVMSAPAPETIATGLAKAKPVLTLVAPAVAPPSVSVWPLPQPRSPSRLSLSARVPAAAVPTPRLVPAV